MATDYWWEHLFDVCTNLAHEVNNSIKNVFTLECVFLMCGGGVTSQVTSGGAGGDVGVPHSE